MLLAPQAWLPLDATLMVRYPCHARTANKQQTTPPCLRGHCCRRLPCAVTHFGSFLNVARQPTLGWPRATTKNSRCSFTLAETRSGNTQKGRGVEGNEYSLQVCCCCWAWGGKVWLSAKPSPRFVAFEMATNRAGVIGSSLLSYATRVAISVKER